MTDWIDELNERSKDDKALIVGSEVRALVAEVRKLDRALRKIDRHAEAAGLNTVREIAATVLVMVPSDTKDGGK